MHEYAKLIPQKVGGEQHSQSDEYILHLQEPSLKLRCICSL